jgi:hypothetical protein
MNYRFIISRQNCPHKTKPAFSSGDFQLVGAPSVFKQLGRSDDSFRERSGAQKLKLDGDFFMENPING